MPNIINTGTAKFTWTLPTANEDGSPITAGELTGYAIGIRTSAGTAGTYAIVTEIADPAATAEAVSAIGTVLKPGDYLAAIRSEAGSTVSAWSAEVDFSVATPVPKPPSNFAIA